jgi:hypothetical protein
LAPGILKFKKGETLYKIIPVNVLLTFDVDCTKTNGPTEVPCEVYLLKDAKAFFDWDKGIRNPNSW